MAHRDILLFYQTRHLLKHKHRYLLKCYVNNSFVHLGKNCFAFKRISFALPCLYANHMLHFLLKRKGRSLHLKRTINLAFEES